MPITQEQRLARKDHLGSSDIPAILGFSRFNTPYDVWLEKTGRISSSIEDKSTAPQEAGTILEESVLNWAQKGGYVSAFERDVELAIPDTPIVVHIDAREIDSKRPIEAKTEGLFGPIIQTWGEPNTNEVPEYTCLQAQTHIWATDSDMCHVPSFLGGRGFGYFFVQRDEELLKLIRQGVADFWDRVEKDIPPDSQPSLAAAKRIRRVEGEPAKLNEEIVQKWLEAREKATAAEKEKDIAHATILAALDGKAEGICQQGLITNYMQSKKEHLVQACTYPVMRFKKGKI